jgi:hypothetical protein
MKEIVYCDECSYLFSSPSGCVQNPEMDCSGLGTAVFVFFAFSLVSLLIAGALEYYGFPRRKKR